MSAAVDLLRALRDGDPIHELCAVVVAHPDDETLGLGQRLSSFRRLDLVHVTSGAPRDDGDAHRAGYPDALSYSTARARELDYALERLGARPTARRQMDFTDGEVVFALRDLVARLEPVLEDAAFVFTHPYEGGHPDHDAVAAAVAAACRRIASRDRRAPVRLEFAGYHLGPHGQVSGAFHPDPARPETRPRPDGAALAAKRSAFAAFASQASVLEWFTPEAEAYRQAPDYDFTAPPPPGRALYDGWGWALTSERWREAAATALERADA